MNSIINAIFGILLLLGVGTMTKSFYCAVKRETVTKVYHGLGKLELFTQKLTKTKLKY